MDFIDESEVLTMADDECHVNKNNFKVPFVCGARNLGEALRRVAEGATMIRTKGEAGTGNVVNAVHHARAINKDVRKLKTMDADEMYNFAKEIGAPYALVKQTAELGRLPVVNFAAGGIATPADAAMMMQLGMDGVFVGSGIFKSDNPAKRARAIVQATTNFNDAKVRADPRLPVQPRCLMPSPPPPRLPSTAGNRTRIRGPRGTHGWHQLRGHEGEVRRPRGGQPRGCHGPGGAGIQEGAQRVVAFRDEGSV